MQCGKNVTKADLKILNGSINHKCVNKNINVTFLLLNPPKYLAPKTSTVITVLYKNWRMSQNYFQQQSSAFLWKDTMFAVNGIKSYNNYECMSHMSRTKRLFWGWQWLSRIKMRNPPPGRDETDETPPSLLSSSLQMDRYGSLFSNLI